MLKLYSYFRSSASYRVRIALHWKKIPFEYVPVHLIKEGGQQRQSDFLKVNPMGHVPALDHDGFLLFESMAMIQYLEDAFPQNALLPRAAPEKARAIQLCEILNSGIQPLQNLKVNQYLASSLGQSKAEVERWNQHWISKGLSSLEKMLESTAGTFAMGGDFSAVDCFLIPQCFASRRMGVKVEDYPTIHRIEQAALKLEAVQKAHPEKQPDYARDVQ